MSHVWARKAEVTLRCVNTKLPLVYRIQTTDTLGRRVFPEQKKQRDTAISLEHALQITGLVPTWCVHL